VVLRALVAAHNRGAFMEINSLMLFYLLEKKFSLNYVNECQGLKVHSPLLLETGRLEENYVYISDDPEKLRAISYAAPCALLLVGPADRYELSPLFRNCDIACIEGPSAVQALQTVYALFLELLNWDMRLNNASLEGAEYAKMFKIIRELYDMPLMLHDRNFFNIAYDQDFYHFVGSDEESREQIPLELINDFVIDEHDAHNVFARREPFVYPPSGGGRRWLCCNIFNDNYFQGRLIALHDGKSANLNGQLDLLAHYCGYISRVFTHHAKDLVEKKQKDPLHGALRMYIVESRDIMERELAAVLKEADWQIRDSYVLVLFQLSEEDEYSSRSSYMCRQLESAIPKSCAVMANPFILWVIAGQFEKNPLNKYGDFQKLIPDLAQKFYCKAGISDQLDAFTDLRNAYTQAGAALQLGRKKDARLGCYWFSDYVMDYIMDRAAGELSADNLLHPGISALRDYDRENGTEYLKTIRYFTNARYNMTVAASQMPIHRLTFLRRLEKIRDISHIDFENPDELLHVHLSIKLLDSF
jgi:sugar diacid utilization regulator